ncbi:protein translocase subunit secA [Stackebrandtia endophytica]|uniref:Protein translocase subunit SecA n=1 Tax=Stackebrandtia endophytica TaxID=1496996 RepID=A0A543AT50_9ACTN|nr:preprotein translocase subunit SecA [Stackebrandtia endophytica]TQL75751.1 protein translocase subunit secA [Stackebrandtia endophytica]
MSIFEKLLRAGEGRTLKQVKAIAVAVNTLEEDYVDLTDAELRAKTDEFREQLDDGEASLDDLMPEAFAVVREAAKRVRGMRHFDVQIMGGAALHRGMIPEMRTGEGKTLVSTLPAYLNALSGDGVHIITTNDYLAQRDAEWMGEIHRFLGLTVGVVLPGAGAAKHREAYKCDITYGTNNEFGFDYLRDNMARSIDNQVQRGHNFAIVDEVDSILIDEARTPLIISGPAAQSARWYEEFSKIVSRMKLGTHYEVDEAKNTVAVSEEGVARVEDRLGVENLYESANTLLVGYLNNAIKAKELFKRDKDYIVSDEGEVLIVDQFTGRVLAGRRYNEGMHQAIEAKEGVKIKQENQTLATVTLQNYFRLYNKLAGMTGTASTEAGEFNKVYNVGVVEIPTHRDMVRKDRVDVVYKTQAAKFQAVVEDIVERHETGQPVLVGTVSVDHSELLSDMLRKRGVEHSVLNAKHHAREAEIIAQAGRKSAVTVATNMAGRGTDILLGGNPEYLAAAELRSRGVDEADEEKYSKEWDRALRKWTEECDVEGEEVRDVGGLYVLGTERHESRRIDNQLRGRAGRQGDPGESRFYLSLQDDLMRKFNAAAVEALMSRLNMPDDMPIENKMVSRMIQSAQAQIEGQNAEQRKNVLKYDEVMNKQRQVIYAERLRVLEGEDVNDEINNMVEDVVTAYVNGATSDGYTEDWDLDEMWKGIKELYPIGVTVEEVEEAAGGRDKLEPDDIVEAILEDVRKAYDAREEEVGGAEVMRTLERNVLLEVIDRKWREHLYEMDYLKEGITLRAYAQRDPVIEYQREGYDMFNVMLDGIKEDTVRYLFNLNVKVEETEPEQPTATAKGKGKQGRKPSPSSSAMATVTARGLVPAGQPEKLSYSAPTLDGEGGVEVAEETPAALRGGKGPSSRIATGAKKAAPGQKVGSAPGRNEPCHCGSGKKYKRCHGSPGGK